MLTTSDTPEVVGRLFSSGMRLGNGSGVQAGRVVGNAKLKFVAIPEPHYYPELIDEQMGDSGCPISFPCKADDRLPFYLLALGTACVWGAGQGQVLQPLPLEDPPSTQIWSKISTWFA